ncbi:MAG: DUF615 domain-containing protein [Deltaproteobacteria bacterium]|jgi:ribosome-associated protein|nr:DUF615 domain-containing protein [Deltaproteobacteria bacterium]
MSEEQQTEILYGQGELGKSRSQKKRESSALQNLGEELAALSQSQVANFELDEDLRAAIVELHKLKKHEATRRQMQYIGRLMRELDEDEVTAISRQLEALRRNR